MGFLIHWKKQRAMTKTESIVEEKDEAKDVSTTGPKNHWIHITDEMIVNVGYKNNSEKQTNSRTHMFAYLKTHFIKDKDYMLTSIQGTTKGKGEHNKQVLK